MNEYRIQTKLMGSIFELIIGHDHQEKAEYLLKMAIAEISRIEDLLSEFREHTSTSHINANAGIAPVTVSQEVYGLIERCQRISALTQGAFDITVGPLKKIYRFKNAEFQIPEKAMVQEALSRTGYKYIQLSASTSSIYLSRRNMSLSFAAIGKGYAADCVRKLWMQNGVSSGVISASGDLCTIGYKADGSPWKIGIADPDQKDTMLFYIPLKQHSSVATSGDYEQYFIHQGTRYSHNINPLSGKPVSGIKSVSVMSPGAELSDALATAVTIMGVEAGLHMINQLPETHCLVIDDHNCVHTSKQIEIEYEK
jgi:thiamine biosynthesis lipoprotein